MRCERLRSFCRKPPFLLKEQATEAALKGVHAPSLLHVATHGFFLQERGSANAEGAIEKEHGWANGRSAWRIRCCVQDWHWPELIEASSGSDDGVLTALEAAGLDLWGTKLVVLSACDTGLGEVKNGDGVYGLRRALVLAGAESQMMSLWQVSDRSTRDLMVGYYRGLMQSAGCGRGYATGSVTDAAQQISRSSVLLGELYPIGRMGESGR